MLMMIFSLSMLPPMLVSVIYEDGQLLPFLQAFGLILLIGGLIWFPFRKLRKELRVRDGFLITVLFWLVLSLSGSIPLYVSDNPTYTF